MDASKGEKITAIVDLMEDTDGDLIGVVEHILLETPGFNYDDAEVLSWFPDELLTEALRWLQERHQEIEDEDAEDEEL
jgi:hypothetical protein